MHHLTCGISSLLHSVNLILFTVLLVHLILHISPHHSHQLRSNHLSLPRPFTPDLKLISFTNPFLHSLLIPSGLSSRILNLYWTNWALVFTDFCFSFVCYRLSWSHSAFESTLNSPIVSYIPVYISSSPGILTATMDANVDKWNCFRIQRFSPVSSSDTVSQTCSFLKHTIIIWTRWQGLLNSEVVYF